ncbi:MAG: cell division protein SepF [Ruminococcus sp.]|nr:cell division protein SepF [Ruminococcus sp.]
MGIMKGLKNLFVGEDDSDQVEFQPNYDSSYEYSRENSGARRNYSEDFGNYSSRSGSGYGNYNDYSSYSAQRNENQESERQMNVEQTKTLQIVLARPEDFSEVRDIGDDINALKTVILNLEMVKSDDAKRILDFLSGVAYANKAQIKMMAQKTFAIMAKNVEFDGKDLMTELENNGYSF